MPSVHSLRGLHFFSSWPESTAGQKGRRFSICSRFSVNSRSKGTALLRCTPPTQEDTHLAKRGHPRRLWVASTGSRFQRRCTSSSGIVAENCGVCSRPIVKLSGAKGGPCLLHTSVHYAKRPGKGTSYSLSQLTGIRLLLLS